MGGNYTVCLNCTGGLLYCLSKLYCWEVGNYFVHLNCIVGYCIVPLNCIGGGPSQL